MLPGMDGYQVLEGVRARKQTPVLMLAARGSVDERVKGLRLGADDYLPKPFSLIELVARIQALVRRRPSDGADITQLHIQDLHLDLLARRVFRGGTRLELTAKEFSLLISVVSGLIRCSTLTTTSVFPRLMSPLNLVPAPPGIRIQQVSD